MSTTDDFARLATAQIRIQRELDRVRQLIAYAAPHESLEARRHLVFGEASGDLYAALSRGHGDVTNEWALVAAVALNAMLDHEENLARCICTLQTGVPSEAKLTHPDCPAHGEKRAA